PARGVFRFARRALLCRRHVPIARDGVERRPLLDAALRVSGPVEGPVRRDRGDRSRGLRRGGREEQQGKYDQLPGPMHGRGYAVGVPEMTVWVMTKGMARSDAHARRTRFARRA